MPTRFWETVSLRDMTMIKEFIVLLVLTHGISKQRWLRQVIPYYYIHTEKYSPKSYFVNFRTQISSSQSEERTIVFTREKNDTYVFSRVRKMIRPIRSHRGARVSRQNSRLLLQLAAPLRTHSTRKFYSKSFSR